MWLSCNSTKLFKKKIWKPVLGCLRVFHSACNKSQDMRQSQLHIFSTGDSEAAHRHQIVRHETNDCELVIANGLCHPTHILMLSCKPSAFLATKSFLQELTPLQDRWTPYMLVFWVCWLIWISNPLDFGMIILTFTWKPGWGQVMHQATGSKEQSWFPLFSH